MSPSQPSGAAATVTILHDCAHPSTLRFQTLAAVPDLLNVLEVDEPQPLQPEPVAATSSDGGGLASAPICGVTPPRAAEVDRAAPVLRARVPRRLRRGRRHAARITLSEAARVRASLVRTAPLRRHIGTVVAERPAGTSRLRLAPRFDGRRLRRGRYRLTLRATDAAGNRSRRVTLPFKVV